MLHQIPLPSFTIREFAVFVRFNVAASMMLLLMSIMSYSANVFARPPGWEEYREPCEYVCYCIDGDILFIQSESVQCRIGAYALCCLQACGYLLGDNPCDIACAPNYTIQ